MRQQRLRLSRASIPSTTRRWWPTFARHGHQFIGQDIARLRACVLRFRVDCAGFTLMGNFDLVLFGERFRRLSRRSMS